MITKAERDEWRKAWECDGGPDCQRAVRLLDALDEADRTLAKYRMAKRDLEKRIAELERRHDKQMRADEQTHKDLTAMLADKQARIAELEAERDKMHAEIIDANKENDELRREVNWHEAGRP